MPDIHWGYGFPIGGVAGDRPGRAGVVSPGGVGYDINCGVRLLRSTRLDVDEVRPRIEDSSPRSSGTSRPASARPARDLQASGRASSRALLEQGAALGGRAQGFGQRRRPRATSRRAAACAGADSDEVSRARRASAARDQLGTLGSGNHFVEVQMVDEIYDAGAAEALRPVPRSGHAS